MELDLRCILKVEIIEFVDRFYVGYEREWGIR